MNKILKILIFNDFFFWTALGFVGPILAIYINDEIKGATLGLTGVAMAIYWIVKALTSLVTSKYTDREPGNKAEFWTLIWGSVLLFIIPVGYILATSIWHIIIVQALFGFGAGFIFPGWMTIFTRFLDSGKEGFTWSLDSSVISLGNGIAIGASGFIAEAFGFDALFFIVLVLNFFSLVMVLWLIKFKDEILSNHNPIKLFFRKIFH